MLKVNIIKCGFESLKMFGFFEISQKQHEKNYIYMKLSLPKMLSTITTNRTEELYVQVK